MTFRVGLSIALTVAVTTMVSPATTPPGGPPAPDFSASRSAARAVPARAIAVEHARRRAIHQAEPLPAERRHVVRERRVGRDEGGMRQGAREIGRQADQVVAVGADAVQQHDELLRRPARRRPLARAVERRVQAAGLALRAGHWRNPDTIAI